MRFALLVLVACDSPNGDAPLGTSRAVPQPAGAWLSPGLDYFCRPGSECTKANEPGSVASRHVICFGTGDELAARDRVPAAAGHCFLSFPDCEAARGSAASCQPY